jgi:hypothetical protein
MEDGITMSNSCRAAPSWKADEFSVMLVLPELFKADVMSVHNHPMFLFVAV